MAYRLLVPSFLTVRFLMVTSVALTFADSMSPTKMPKGCRDPISPKRGIFRLSADRATAEFLCQPGHALVGQRVVTCNKGVWSERPPVCVGSDCEIPMIKDASITSQHGGGVLRIQCRSGYSLTDGTGTMACIDGQWNATNPKCIDKKRIQSEKSSRNHQNFIGKQRTSEATSEGDPAAKRSHKEWLEESDYSCVALHPPPAPNARPVTRWAMYDGLPRLYATYHCKWGFKPSAGVGVRNVYCKNGQWLGSIPKCQTVVYEEPNQMDFSGIVSTLSHDELLLRADYTCVDKGRYDDDIAAPPPVLKNALSGNALRFVILEGRPRLYVEYACSDGFRLENARRAHLYCRDKRWIGEMPKCVPEPKKSCASNNGGCSQLCSEDRGRRLIVCSCKDGFQLQPDKVSCTDVDECEVNSGYCDHLCDNTVGSFTCSCFPGYSLQKNSRNCSKTNLS